jgi:hypothetical protein
MMDKKIDIENSVNLLNEIAVLVYRYMHDEADCVDARETLIDIYNLLEMAKK